MNTPQPPADAPKHATPAASREKKSKKPKSKPDILLGRIRILKGDFVVDFK
jgi:hypothetical protein